MSLSADGLGTYTLLFNKGFVIIVFSGDGTLPAAIISI